MARAVVVYESMFGNTQEVARAVAEGLAAHLPVETVEVSDAPVTVADDQVLVVGGPTHAFSMSRARTRQDAAAQATASVVSRGTGVREYLDRLEVAPGQPWAASFDTKVERPRLPGSAARAIEQRLRRKGCRIAHPAQTFRVRGTTGPLSAGELGRARGFGERIGERVTGGTQPDQTKPDQTKPDQTEPGGSGHRTTRHTLLALLAALMAVGGVGGAVGLFVGAPDFFGPDTAEIYSRLPFESPQFAGAALLVAVVLPMAVTAVLAWRGSRHAAAAGAAAGTVLVGWIIVQLAFIGAVFWLQPACAAVGLVVNYLAITLNRSVEPARPLRRSVASRR